MKNEQLGALQVSSIVRLEGSPDDPEQIADLVWAPCPVNKMLWPAEMLDPLNLPPCRSIPSRAINHMTKQQRVSWLPRDLWHPDDDVGGDLAFGDAGGSPAGEQGNCSPLASSSVVLYIFRAYCILSEHSIMQ